jgi:hypothetical protein
MTSIPTTRNVTRVFRTATAAEIAAGADWYRDAHTIAQGMASAYGVTPEIAAGVLAALSPLNSWGANVNLAHRFLAAGGLDAGYLSMGLDKARRILAGEDPVKTLNGLKTVNFYRSILSAGAQGVCIDRHAYSIAHNTRTVDVPSLGAKRYAEIAACYVKAARILSRELGETITPAQVQSVTWVLWRRRYWAEGAFDGEA